MCYLHPDRTPVGSCLNCGQLVCAECEVFLNERIYCNPCAKKIFPPDIVTTKPKHANWFERHLNWVVVLTVLAFYPLDFLIGFLLGIVIYNGNPSMSDETVGDIALVVTTVLNIIILVLVAGWVLRKKARSLWNLLLLIVPFGLIIFLCLENRS